MTSEIQSPGIVDNLWLDLDLRPQPSLPTEWSPAIHNHAPVVVTRVYETYWRFACERQAIYMRRISGGRPPWTDDPILELHRFTNAYRAADRVSQYLIRRVIYEGDQSPDEVFFRTILFRMFNKIETWELLNSELGSVSHSEDSLASVEKALLASVRAGKTLYSAAYIIPPIPGYKGDFKFQGHLELLSTMMADEVPQRVSGANTLEEVFQLLRSYPGLGDFLAFQFTIDLNYSEVCDFPESDFVVPGPGALSGISKCFRDLGGLSEEELIHLMSQIQDEEFERLGLRFDSLGGRPLQPIDLQNLFCEVDKYSRVAHPDIRGASTRSRIKQKYKPFPRPLPKPWFPPKWGINDADTAASPGVDSVVPGFAATQPLLFP